MIWEDSYEFPDEQALEYYEEDIEMTIIEGAIERMHTKTGQGKKGPWTKYSAVINGGWVNFGFDDPGFAQGDIVKVKCEEDQYGQQVKQSKLITKGTDKPANASGNDSSGGSRNSDYANGQAWGNSNNVAASVLASLVSIDGVAITAATGKANKAKRFDELMDIFDKLRVQFYQDSQDIQRVLDRVADAGAVEDNTPPALPAGEVKTEEEAGVMDEFEEDDDF